MARMAWALAALLPLAALLLPLATVAAQEEGAAKPAAKPLFRLLPQDDYTMELAFAALFGLYLVNLFLGNRRNESLATYWVTEMVRRGGALDRNFALVGPNEDAASKGEVLMKESGDTFRLYASGRRYCQGLLATLHLRKRQDLFALAWGLASPSKDLLEVEVALAEGAMPPAVFAVATPALAKQLLSEQKDLEVFAKRVEAPKELRSAGWPSDRLVLLAEHSTLVPELLPGSVVEAVFSAAAFPALRRHFRFLHVSSEYEGAEGEARRPVVRLSLSLPPEGDPEALDRLLAAALAVADAAATFRPTPEQAKRAAEARKRKEAQDFKAAGEDRAARAEERRAAKAAEEKERLRRMTPEQRAKELERQRRVQLKRQQRSMVRMK